METLELDTITQRLIDILKPRLMPKTNKSVKDIVFGHPKSEITGNDKGTPFIWVAPSDSPIVTQKNINRGSPPAEELMVEFWCVITTKTDTTSTSQKNAMSIATLIERSLKANHRLLNSNGKNDLGIITSKHKIIPRQPQPYGQTVQAYNVMTHITLIIQPAQE